MGERFRVRLVWLSALLLAGSAAAADVEVFNDRFQSSCMTLSLEGGVVGTPLPPVSEGSTLTLRGEGRCDFGAEGPELIFLLDVSRLPSGAVDRASIRLCPSCAIDGGDSHSVAPAAAMPGGQGLVMGASGD